MKNVRHVPDLRYQLISVSTVSKAGIKTSFDDAEALLSNQKSGDIIASGTLKDNGLYTLNIVRKNQDFETALVASLHLWHERVAHVDPAGIKAMADRKVFEGLTYSSSKFSIWKGCILGKSCQSHIPKVSNSKSSKLLELVLTNVLGPIEVPSVGGSRYAITFIDDYSNWAVQFSVRAKSEALDCFKRYKKLAETHTNQRLQKLHANYSMHGESESSTDELHLQVLHSDNGGVLIE